MTWDLDLTPLRDLPGRCPECLAHPATQGHADGCSQHTPPATLLGEPVPTGATCQQWHADTGTVCGSTDGVRVYLPGVCCVNCAPHGI